jgi:hypothetical protein
MTEPFPSAVVAELNQWLAGWNESLDRWITVFREQAAKTGEQQARANAGLTLSYFDADTKDSLLLTALIRLAEMERGGTRRENRET